MTAAQSNTRASAIGIQEGADSSLRPKDRSGENFWDAFVRTADRFDSRVAVEERRREGDSVVRYDALRRRAETVSADLTAMGVNQGESCAILAENSADWCAAFLGVLRAGGVAVPLDTHYTAGQIETLLRDSKAKVLFASSAFTGTANEAARKLSRLNAKPMVKGIEARNEKPDESLRRSDAIPPESSVGREDPAVVLYTSGTTGDPKGVVLTHGNLLAEAEAVFQVLKVNEEDSILGVMPLYHSLALMANLLLPFVVGARVVYLEEISAGLILSTLQGSRISLFCCVPQLFYLIHQRVLASTAEKGRIFRVLFRSLMSANAALRRRSGLNAGKWIFRPVHEIFGRNIRYLVTGGARFDPAVGRDFYALGFSLIEAFGLTESSAAAALTRPGEGGRGHVGKALPGVEIRIQAADGQGSAGEGEIGIRGPIVMQGYLHRPDATAETIQGGWLLTGDLGRFDEQGNLQITGRIKEVIVLSSGKNIYPEEIEAHYGQSPYIQEICVLGRVRPGEPAAERLHAVIVPNREAMKARGIVNLREVLRFEIENLSIHLPAHKRVLSFEVRMEALPRTATNKLKRHEINAQPDTGERPKSQEFVRGKTPTEEEIRWSADPGVARALELVRKFSHEPEAIRPDANLELDLGLDSVERVELVTILEQTFGSQIPAEGFASIFTVRQLVDAVRPHLGEAAAAASEDPWGALLDRPAEEESQLEDVLGPRPIFALIAFAALKLAKLLAGATLGLRVSGTEQLPAEGAYLICPNHQSYVDPFLVGSALPLRTFRRVFSVGASEYFATPFLRWVARMMHVVPVDPDVNLSRAMQAGAAGLKRNLILILFPEGERSIDGKVKAFKKGASILSLQLRVPVVPVAIEGTFDFWPRNRRIQWGTCLPWRGHRVRIQFGRPIPPPPARSERGSSAEMENRYASFTRQLQDEVTRMKDSLLSEGGQRSTKSAD